jgi:hypothetical protein
MSELLPAGTLRQLLRRPRSIPNAIGAAAALAPRGWWRHRPFLPLPDPAYWRFRMETASGGEGDARPSPQEVVEVADWFHRMRQRRR